MYQFNEITLIHPDTLVPIKQVTATWQYNETLDIDDFLSQMRTFLLQDKNKDFPTKAILTSFLQTVNEHNSPRIKTSVKLENAKFLIFNTKLDGYTDPSFFAELLYTELSERIKDSESIEVFNLSFSPTVLDPISNKLQQEVMLWYRSVPIWSTFNNNNVEGISKLK